MKMIIDVQIDENYEEVITNEERNIIVPYLSELIENLSLHLNDQK